MMQCLQVVLGRLASTVDGDRGAVSQSAAISHMGACDIFRTRPRQLEYPFCYR